MTAQAKVIRVHNNLPLRMHASPFIGARIVSKLPVGAIVDIEAVEGSWMCVYDPKSGHSGWVDRKYVQELPPPQPDIPAPPVDLQIDTAIRNGWLLVGGAILFFVVFGLCLIGWIT
jgi:hypothetical protein